MDGNVARGGKERCIKSMHIRRLEPASTSKVYMEGYYYNKSQRNITGGCDMD
jgi:hypothetical protein